jgi:hypothetical protein
MPVSALLVSAPPVSALVASALLVSALPVSALVASAVPASSPASGEGGVTEDNVPPPHATRETEKAKAANG